MKMDHQSFRTGTVIRCPESAQQVSLRPGRAAFGAIFLLVTLVLWVPTLFVGSAGLLLLSAARFIRDCVIYSAEVTVGRS